MTVSLPALLAWPILALAIAALIIGSLTEPTPGARTRSQLREKARQAGFWRVLGWTLAFLLVIAPAVATWYALRTAVYWLARVVAAAAAWVASEAAMDGRPVQVYRVAGGRA